MWKPAVISSRSCAAAAAARSFCCLHAAWAIASHAPISRMPGWSINTARGLRTTTITCARFLQGAEIKQLILVPLLGNGKSRRGCSGAARGGVRVGASPGRKSRQVAIDGWEGMRPSYSLAAEVIQAITPRRCSSKKQRAVASMSARALWAESTPRPKRWRCSSSSLGHL